MSDAPDHDDDRALTGEYVLGLLPEDERAAFEARLEAEPDLRAMVRAWSEDLVHLSDAVAPVAPPAHVLGRIERDLFGAHERQGVGRWLRGWAFGGLAVAGLVLALLLGTDVLQQSPQMPGDPAYVAEIAGEDRSLVLSAAYDAQAGQLHIRRDVGQARPGRSLELWLIEGGHAPVSLGVLSGQHAVVTLDETQRAVLNGAVLAVSDEPIGGSPTGAPTGDVLGTGEITNT